MSPVKNSLQLDFLVRCVQCKKCEGKSNGIIFQGLQYKHKPLIETPEENYAGPWFSFTLPDRDETWVQIKNIARVEDLKLVEEKKGDLRKRVRFHYEKTVPSLEEKLSLNVVTEIEIQRDPVIFCFFGVQNCSNFSLQDFSVQFLIDFDIGGFFHHDNDIGTFTKLKLGKEELHLLTQRDNSGFFTGFGSSIPPVGWEVFDPTNFTLSNDRRHLGKVDSRGPLDIGLAMEWGRLELPPNAYYSIPLLLFGGDRSIKLDSLLENATVRLANLHTRFTKVFEEQF